MHTLADTGASSPAPVDDPDDDRDPPRRLSIPRVVLAVVVLVAAVAGAAWAIRGALSPTATSPTRATFFSPYVDTTLTPVAQFQDPSADVARQVTLGFVVAAPGNGDGCTPSWGGFYGLDQADGALNLDRRIAQLRDAGGDVMVSFGGQANTELAQRCTDPVALEAAYRSVVTRYHLRAVDFDVEGAAVADPASVERRATAVAALQRAQGRAGSPLSVWLTLPAATDGLTAPALAVVSATLAGGVTLAGVNVMAMDFGSPQPAMGAAVRRSLDAAHAQLEAVYRRYGAASTSAATWNRMGVTVMIGQNDTTGEIFTTGDASALVNYVKSRHLGRLSMWSLNRDAQCGSAFAEIGVHANTCSGTAQQALAFSHIFASFTAAAPAPSASSTTATPRVVTSDNPATSPYPVWQPTRPYVAGYKVVRLGEVYQAKWYTQGDDPAATVPLGAPSPWQLIGPVLPGEHPAPTTTLPAGTHPAWSPSATYTAGAEVLYNGLPYRAKWYNQATSPGAEDADPSASPWQPLFTVPGEPAGS